MEFFSLIHHKCESNPKAMLNISSNLYKSEWTDLVFKNRNKSYGAYILRAESSAITMKAFFIAAPLFVALFAGPLIYQRLHPDVKVDEVKMTPVELSKPPVTDKIFEKKEEKPKAEPVHEKVKTVAMSANIKVVDKPVADITPPTIDDIKDAVIGQVTQAGAATSSSVTPVVTDNKGSGAGGIGTEDNSVHDAAGIDMNPEFEGGMAAWSKYIRKNLRYPSMAQEDGIQGKVFIGFVVEKDGSISDVTILKGIGGGCDEEAMRVIKKSPKWRPGQQQNNKVRVRYTMPISFLIG